MARSIYKMYQIVRKVSLNPTVTKMDIYAPFVAKKAKPGQFIILRVDEDGERIPLTVADYDREAGTVSIIFQIVGGGTQRLNAKEEGDYIPDFVGPLGRPTHIEGLKKVCVVGGGVGCAIAYPQAKALHQAGIRFFGGVQGEADSAVEALLASSLNYDPLARCDHHDHDHHHGEGHSCSDHSCSH